MNYELAKALKDAGFPFKRWSSGDRMDDLSHFDRIAPFLNPTLSELIEACDLIVEDVVVLQGHKGQWTAVDGRDGFGIHAGGGSTPEEAIARLYICIKHGLTRK